MHNRQSYILSSKQLQRQVNRFFFMSQLSAQRIIKGSPLLHRQNRINKAWVSSHYTLQYEEMVFDIFSNDKLQYLFIFLFQLFYCLLLLSFMLNHIDKNQFKINFANTFQDILGGVPKKTAITTAPLSSLKPMMVHQLKLNHTHQGYYLKLRITFAYRAVAVQIECEDDSREYAKVSIYNFNFKDRQFSHYFYPNRVFFVKEPFFKVALDHKTNVRIDDPSDVVFEDQQKMSVQDYKRDGRLLVGQSKFVEAYCLYDEALTHCKEDRDRIALLLNKALMCFKLNLKEEYGENVRKVMSIDPKNEKANYHLFKYQAFSRKKQISLESMKQRIKRNTYMRQEVKRQLQEFIQMFFSFATNKNINWFKAIKSRSVGQFFSPKVVIGKSPYGRGMFAAGDIGPGQILIVQHPLAFVMYSVAEEFKNSASQTIKIQNLKSSSIFTNEVLKLLKVSKQFREKFVQLSSKTGSHLRNVKLQDIDINRITEILECNSFGNYQLSEIINGQKKDKRQIYQKKPSMVFEKCCIFNHRCEYNCVWINIGEAMIIIASSEVKKGQQLFVSYQSYRDYNQRQGSLLRIWGIDCDCILCQHQYLQQYNMPIKKESNLIKNRLMIEAGQFKINQMIEKTCDLSFIETMYKMKQIQAGDKMLAKIFPMKKSEINELRTHK